MAKKEITKDDYRSERKERLAKAAKKSQKSHIDSEKLVKAVLAIICVVAVLASVGGGLYAYGVPQRLIPAVEINGRNYSIAEYNYYYSSVYQTYANQAYSIYSQYGFSLGFDHTVDPAAQTTKDEDDKEITYAEFFRDYVVETIEQYSYYLNKAEEEGMTLSDEHAAEIDATIKELETYAAQAGYSADRYISTIYGKGLNVKSFRKLLNEQYLVAQYLENVEEDLYDGISIEDIEATYEKAPDDYQLVDLRIFGFKIEEDKDKEEETTAATETTTAASEETTAATAEEETTAEAEETTAAKEEETTAAKEEETTAATKKEPTEYELLAQEMMNKVTDEASFIELAREYCSEEEAAMFKDDNATLALGISKSTVTSNFDEDLAKWLFSADRKVGDTTTCSSDEYVYVVFVKAPAYREESPLVDARHILSSFETVAEEMAKDTSSKVNTEEADDHEIKTVIASDGKSITNEGTKYSIDVVLKAYEESLKVYKAFNEYEYDDEGENAETVFATLANSYSNDSAEDGLYEGIKKGDMVKPFEEWVYDSSRKPGDVDMIMTSYGWHIMYFVGQHEEAYWIENIRNTLGAEKFEDAETEVKSLTKKTAKTTAFENIAYKLSLKHVNDKLVSSK